MEEIRIVRRFGSNVWWAEHLMSGHPNPRVCSLFDGEHVLPTPFLTTTAPEAVLLELTRLNPGDPGCGSRRGKRKSKRFYRRSDG